MGGADGQTEGAARHDGPRRNDLSAKPLGIVHGTLSYLLADGHHDPLPPYHGSQTQRERHHHDDPLGRIFGQDVDLLEFGP